MAIPAPTPSQPQIRLTESTQSLGQIEVNGVVYNVTVIGGPTINESLLGPTMDKVYAIAKTILGTTKDATRVDITESTATIYKDGQGQTSTIKMTDKNVADQSTLGTSRYQVAGKSWKTTEGEQLNTSIGRTTLTKCVDMFRSIFEAAKAGSSISRTSGATLDSSQGSLLSSTSSSLPQSPPTPLASAGAMSSKGPSIEDDAVSIELTEDSPEAVSSAASEQALVPSSSVQISSEFKAQRALFLAVASVAHDEGLITEESYNTTIRQVQSATTPEYLKGLSHTFFQSLNEVTISDSPILKSNRLIKAAIIILNMAKEEITSDRIACGLMLRHVEDLYAQSCNIMRSDTPGEEPSSEGGEQTKLGLNVSVLEHQFQETSKKLQESIAQPHASSISETGPAAPITSSGNSSESRPPSSAPDAAAVTRTQAATSFGSLLTRKTPTSIGAEAASSIPPSTAASTTHRRARAVPSSGSNADRMPIAPGANHAREHRFFNAKMTIEEYKDGLTKFEARANDRNPIPEYSALYQERTRYTTMDEARKNQLVLAALKKALTDNSTTIVKYLLMRFRPSNAVLEPALEHVDSLRDKHDRARTPGKATTFL